MINKKVITRFAPSPTGHFHVGGIRSALYNFLFARQNNGTYILRSEDTDKERSKIEYENEFLELFDWLGLKHDLFFRQSDRLEIHQKYLKKMMDEGYAYLSKEIPTEEGQRDEVIRFKNPNKKITFTDLILGDITVDTTDLGDFVIARDMNEPLYHLTVVIDDFEMGVTHVIRGQEHTSNTSRQILIQEAIRATRPLYAHLPLILNKERVKLSKRDESVPSAIEYKKRGYIPEALLNFMALNGWNPGGEQEIFTLSELIEKFDISQIQKGGGVFNPEKLEWVNKEHMKHLSEDVRNKEIIDRFQNNPGINQNIKIKDEKFLLKLCPVIFDHISKWGDIDTMIGVGELDYYFNAPQYETNLLYWKANPTPEETKKHLEFILDTLKNTPEDNFSNSEKIKSLIFDYATKNGRGQVLWPLRVALSGKDKSPDPFTLIYIMGKTETISRIDEAIKKLS
ncbi:MAG: glutamate--tRNA ligase family protein [Candidatus Zambryskibacteria bacterium]|nr:glutamate--tRNA ligase family protein [Candidatus Zambryskibacteria bacterium]